MKFAHKHSDTGSLSLSNFRVLIMLMIKSRKRITNHEQVAFIMLKQAIYSKLVELIKFSESNLKYLFQAFIRYGFELQHLQINHTRDEEKKA